MLCTPLEAAHGGFHQLRGRPQRYALSVNKNWRITFGWENETAIDLDLEDSH